MHDQTDSQLLCAYAESRSEPAFGELVRRHVDMVYSAALRMVCDEHLARDVAQGVFLALAKNAAPLAGHPVLSGWLHRTTRNLAAQTVRTDVRRRAREQEAAAMNELSAAPDAAWDDIAPLLDAALGELNEMERDAVMLRFFEKKSAPEMAQILGIGDEAAQKRVSRAVERLRDFFSKRNVTIGTSGLAMLISANAVQAAPAGLAAAISATLLVGPVAAASAAIAFTKTIAMTTLQKTIISATLAAAIGTGIYEAHQAAELRGQVRTLRQQVAPLADQIRHLRSERDAATNRLADMADELGNAKANNLEFLKLRAAAARQHDAATIENDPAYKKAVVWLAKEATLREQFEQHPEQKIPEMKYLSGEEWLDQARKADLDTPNGLRCALSNVRSAATFNFAQKACEALRAYMAAHDQQPPDSTAQLSAYFQPRLEDADALLSRYEMLGSEARANPAYQGALMMQKPQTLVDHIDNAPLIGPTTTSSLPPPNWPGVLPDELMPVVRAYADANQHGFLSIYDLQPYAATPAQKEALDKFIAAATVLR